mmetsp:Transcript_95143/g.268827  ORF Transcript_95143/g.268827 Transcript_95143/m.268827 type:complete len:380 (-) Transcript_95143:79-1218(-)
MLRVPCRMLSPRLCVAVPSALAAIGRPPAGLVRVSALLARRGAAVTARSAAGGSSDARGCSASGTFLVSAGVGSAVLLAHRGTVLENPCGARAEASPCQHRSIRSFSVARGPNVRCEDLGAGPTTSRAKIVVFGDSLTQQGFSVGGWVQRLADTYTRRADVLNRGLSGYNTRWASHVLKSLLADDIGRGVVLWVVWFGANDAAMPGTHRQHVPVAEYEENLRSMLDEIRAASPKSPPKIVLVTPPALDEEQWFAFVRQKNPALAASDRTDEAMGRYALAARRVAAACDAEVIDLHAAMHSQRDSPGHYLSDGLHLNTAGNALVYDLLADLIEQRLSWLAVRPCKFSGSYHSSGSSSPLVQEFPWHDQITPEPPHHGMFK